MILNILLGVFYWNLSIFQSDIVRKTKNSRISFKKSNPSSKVWKLTYFYTFQHFSFCCIWWPISNTFLCTCSSVFKGILKTARTPILQLKIFFCVKKFALRDIFSYFSTSFWFSLSVESQLNTTRFLCWPTTLCVCFVFFFLNKEKRGLLKEKLTKTFLFPHLLFIDIGDVLQHKKLAF